MDSDPTIRLIVFDLGGVLMRIVSGWEEACQRAGFDPTHFTAITTSNPGRELDLQDLWRAHETGKISSHEVYAKAGKILEIPPHTLAAIVAAWLIGPYPGVTELLTQLQTRGMVTACLSNTNLDHWESMSASSGPAALPLHLLNHRFASPMIGYAKPSPAAYDYVETHTGVARQQILYFDDHLPNITAASRRGWQTIQIDPTGDTVAQIRRALEKRGLLR